VHAHILYLRSIFLKFSLKFEILMGQFLFDYEIWWRLREDVGVFGAQTVSVVQNFPNLGGGGAGGGGPHFWGGLQKVT